MAGKKTQAQLTPEEKLQQALVPTAEQPYKVPANWCWTYLKNVSDCLDNFRKPINANERNARLGDVPYYGATGQVGWIDDYLTNEELVLLGEDGAPFLDLLKNKAYLINGKAWVNNHAHILRSKFGTMGNRLLIEYLNSFDFTGFVTGTTRLKLTQASMNKIIIPLVPLAEQQRIVERIESLFAKLDEAKENMQNVLEGFETRKAAILHKAFTGELTANWRKQHGVSMESWEEKALQEVCSSIYDGDHMPPPKSETGIPFLVISNVNTGYLSFENTRFVPEEYYNSLNMVRKPCKGDVLYTLVGSYGISVIVDTDRNFCFQRHMALLKPKNIDTRYLWYTLQTQQTYEKATKIATGTAQLTVPIKGLRQMEIYVPTLQEQTEIVRIIDGLLAKEQQAKELAENVLDKIELIKKSILARAFRGELGTNNLADEPAVELLKRML